MCGLDQDEYEESRPSSGMEGGGMTAAGIASHRMGMKNQVNERVGSLNQFPTPKGGGKRK